MLPSTAQLQAWSRYACQCNGCESLARYITFRWGKRMVSAAGRAYPDLLEVALSVPLFFRASAEEQRETVIHEVCHLIDYHQGGVGGHGESWRQAMGLCGLRPRRTHQIDVSGLGQRHHQAWCGCPGPRDITTTRVNKMKKGLQYRCRRCGEGLRLTPTSGQAAAQQAEERHMSAAKKKEDPVTKIQQALDKHGPLTTPDLARKTRLSQDQVRRNGPKVPNVQVAKEPGKPQVFSLVARHHKQARPTKRKKPTITSVATELIQTGKTDEQVLQALAKQVEGFDPEAKKAYPGWYRSKLVREGVITKAFADKHRH